MIALGKKGRACIALISPLAKAIEVVGGQERVISPLIDSYIFVDQDCGIGTCHTIPPTVTPASFIEKMPRSGLHLCCVHDGIAHDMVTESGLTGTGGLLPKHGSEGHKALVVTTVTKSTA